VLTSFQSNYYILKTVRNNKSVGQLQTAILFGENQRTNSIHIRHKIKLKVSVMKTGV